MSHRVDPLVPRSTSPGEKHKKENHETAPFNHAPLETSIAAFHFSSVILHHLMALFPSMSPNPYSADYVALEAFALLSISNRCHPSLLPSPYSLFFSRPTNFSAQSRFASSISRSFIFFTAQLPLILRFSTSPPILHSSIHTNFLIRFTFPLVSLPLRLRVLSICRVLPRCVSDTFSPC